MGEVIAFPDRFDTTGARWEPWVSSVVVASHFGVKERTVRLWRQKGMPSRMVEGSRRYRLSECDRWLTERASS